MRNTILSVALMICLNTAFGQANSSASEIAQISATLMDYIEGTGNGDPERVKRAFHPSLNLYGVTDKDSLRIWPGENYIQNIKPGVKTARIGRIVSIDFEKDAAMAKVAIDVPGVRLFTDYFLLLKYQGTWKIIHKSYTSREYPKTN